MENNKKIYYLIDTNNWKIVMTSVVVDYKIAAAKNTGYMLSNSALRWLGHEELERIKPDLMHKGNKIFKPQD